MAAFVSAPASDAAAASAPASLVMLALATAAFQPPEYQTQSTLLSDRRSPIVGFVWFGTSCSAGVVAGCGVLTEYDVLTAKPSGVTNPSPTGTPLESRSKRPVPASAASATTVPGALGERRRGRGG
jgi:hypothetical protein